MRILVCTLFSLLLSLSSAAAHEFWLSPERWQVEPGEPMEVRLRVGQHFSGASYMYNPARFVRFEVLSEGSAAPVESRLGDDPALQAPAPAEGLAIVVHETTDSLLTYRDRETFETFVTHKNFAGAFAEHAARGLPDDGFKESYRRFAKALIAVGDGDGSDRAVGLATEIVAGTNPYTGDLSDGMPLQVLLDGAPRADAQLELFDRAPDGEVEVTLHRTDSDGRVTVPVIPGHDYLADAVVLRDTGNDDIAAGPVWHSMWASLSFHIPAE